MKKINFNATNNYREIHVLKSIMKSFLGLALDIKAGKELLYE